ncbi:MAG: MFS transporter [Clostridia bacterium]|nr:MFS transporter [Clostridia bacterium]
MQNSTNQTNASRGILSSRIRSANVRLFPEGLLGYLVGPTLALLANSILSGYFNTYMSNVLNITSWAKWFFTWLPVISVVFVVIGNIIVGRLMDSNRFRSGKARPLLLMSVPISVIALLILFVFAPFANGNGDGTIGTAEIWSLILIAIGYNLWFAIAYPFYYTPHAALVSLSTRNSKDRSLLATISNATALAAMGLTSMILPFFLGLLFVYQLDPTQLPVGAVPKFDDAGALQYYMTKAEGGSIIYDQVASYNHWKIFVIALMVITFVGAIVEFMFTRERVTEETMATGIKEEKKKSASLSAQAKVCFKDKFWVIMIVFFLLYQLGGMLKNVSQIYFCQAMFNDAGAYSIEIGGRFAGLISIIGAVPTAVGMVIAWPLSNKIGKGKAILFGAIISAIGGFIGFIAPDNFVVVVIAFVVKALGSTPAMYLSLALLADITDHQEAMHGFRTDGLTMTIYGAIMAGMTGIATGILNGILGAVGYTDTNVSSEIIRTVMPWIFLGGEAICYGVIAITFVFMGVERFSKFDHIAIVADQKAKAEAEGVEYVNPQLKMMLEEAEGDLRSKCEANGLDFDTEFEKVKAEVVAKYEKETAEKAAKENARMSPEKQAAILKEFNELRAANGKEPITAE